MRFFTVVAIAVFAVLATAGISHGYVNGWEKCMVNEEEWYIDCVLIVPIPLSMYDRSPFDYGALHYEGFVHIREAYDGGERLPSYRPLEVVKGLRFYEHQDHTGSGHRRYLTFKPVFNSDGYTSVTDYEGNYHRDIKCVEIEEVSEVVRPGPGEDLEFYCKKDRLVDKFKPLYEQRTPDTVHNTNNVYEGMVYLSRIQRGFTPDTVGRNPVIKILTNNRNGKSLVAIDPTVFYKREAVGDKYGMMSLFSRFNGGDNPQHNVYTLESFIEMSEAEYMRFRMVFRLYDKRAWHMVGQTAAPIPEPTPIDTTLTGDLNGDGVVNIADFLILAEWFGCETGQSPPNCEK